MRDGVFAVLSRERLSGLGAWLPVHYRARFRQSLYAYVQVCLSMYRFGAAKGTEARDSSLVTGSTSHKIVRNDVSRILWWYYNDNVRPLHYALHRVTLNSSAPACIVPDVCRQRSLLRRTLPCAMGALTDRRRTGIGLRPDVANRCGISDRPNILRQERDQYRTAVEGKQDARGCRYRRKASGAGGGAEQV